MGCFSLYLLSFLIISCKAQGQGRREEEDYETNAQIDCEEASSITCDTSALLTIKSKLNQTSKQFYSSWVGDNPCDGNWLHVHCEDVSKNESQFRVTKLSFGEKDWYKLEDGSVNVTRDKNKPMIQFEQEFPIELTKMHWLEYMQFSNSMFNGTIFPEISTMKNLVVIDLEENIIIGRIPPEVSRLQYLQVFDVHKNNIRGSLPLEISALSNLEYLELSFNQITGSLPEEFFSLQNLTVLSASDNQITGTLPPGYSNLKDLTKISVVNNRKFKGSYPVEYSTLPELSEVYVVNTRITDRCKIWQNLDTGDYTYFVQISVEEGQKFCSGILVEKNWVLTSFSCFQRIQNYTQNFLQNEFPNFNNETFQKQYQNSNCYDIEYSKIQIASVTEKCKKYGPNDQPNEQIFEPEFFVVYDQYQTTTLNFSNNNIDNDIYDNKTIYINDFLLLKLNYKQITNFLDTAGVKLATFNYSSINNIYEVFFQVQQQFEDYGVQKTFLSFGQTDVISESSHNNFTCTSKNFQEKVCDQNFEICKNQTYVCGNFNILNADNQFSFSIHSGNPLIQKKINKNSTDVEIVGFFSTEFISNNFQEYYEENSKNYFPYKPGSFSFDSEGIIFVGFTQEILDWVITTTTYYNESKCSDIQVNLEEQQQQQQQSGQHRESTNTAAILVGVFSSVILFVAVVITLFVLWRRYSKKDIIDGPDMKDLNDLIFIESHLQQSNQSQSWWPKVRIPEDVREIPITHLKQVQRLGEGGFAMVFEVEFADDVKQSYNDLCDQHFAVKIINKQFTQMKDQVEALIKEIKVMKDLNSEYVVQLIGASLQLLPSIVMELLPEGSLNKLLYKEEGFKSHQTSLKWKLQLMLNISKGIQYLHSIDITHRDLKPQNILIKDKQSATVKISDFGLSKLKQSTISVQKCVGTMQYMAPEVVLQEDQTITEKVDVWALGVIMQEIILGVEPWKGQNHPYILAQLAKHEPPANGKLPQEGCPQELCTLIKSCWNEAQSRPSTQEIVNKLESILQMESITAEITEQYSSKSSAQKEIQP